MGGDVTGLGAVIDVTGLDMVKFTVSKTFVLIGLNRFLKVHICFFSI
jgi:hypothetical protein